MNLYIFKDGNRQGPFFLQDVQRQKMAGLLKDTDMAWYEGIAEWIPLSQVPGLNQLPPIPAPAYAPMPGMGPGQGKIPWAARWFTAAGLFCGGMMLLTPFLWFFMLLIGGITVGLHHQGESQAAIQMAAQTFGRTYSILFLFLAGLMASILSALVASLLSFSSVLPWCRRS